MSYTFRIYDSIRKVPSGDWQSLRGDETDLYMRPEFLATIEDTLGNAATFWHLLIDDERGRPAAGACLCLYPLDAALLCPPWRRRRLQIIRRIWPRCLLFRILFCGLPFSAGQSHLRLAAGADAHQVFRQLDAAMCQLAAQSRASAIVCKEFCDADLPQTAALCELGYVHGPSLPMNYFAPRCHSFAEFCESLRSHYRYKIRRSQRKFAGGGFRVSHFSGPEALPHYTDEVHKLYLDVHDRAEVQLEVLPAEFFRQLAVRCPEAAQLTAVFQEARVVAFAWGLRQGRAHHNIFVGFDYELNNQYDLYFNLMAADLDQALRQGMEEIQMGQTADVFKSRLGCQGQPRYVYAKGVRWFSARPLRMFHGLLMPPPPPPPDRDLFREA